MSVGKVKVTVGVCGGIAAYKSVELVRLHVPGGTLLAALPELLEGQSIGLVPLVLASLDLCMECGDL